MIVSEEVGNWIYITPIYNLEISTDIEREIRIGRVTFVDIDKIPFIRKRLGFPRVFSDIKNSLSSEKFFKLSSTYGILPFRGIPKLKEYECRKIIEDAINILSFSQLGFSSRHNNSQPDLIEKRELNRNYIIHKDYYKGVLNVAVDSKVLPFKLNNEWKNFHKDFFFLNFLTIYNSASHKNHNTWEKTIIRAAIMAGKSMKSRDLEYSFLWNMIIIEMLLTEQGDKYLTSLPERAEAFIGWAGFWKEKNLKEKIKQLYRKRCKFVHDGNSINIKVEDVLFTDDLVFNLMLNIITHISIFTSKKSIISFSDKVKAEKLLNIKSKVQPKTFRFMSRELAKGLARI